MKIANDSYSEVNEVIRTYPTDFDNLDDNEVFERLPLHLFLMIPFCKGKCSFCPFNTCNVRPHEVEEYIEALLSEFKLHRDDQFIRGRRLSSIWVGGGTPSILPDNAISRVFDEIFSTFSIDASTEITFEANPKSINADLLKLLQKFGVTRLSIGVQSLSDKYLRMLGRGYKRDYVTEIIRLIADHGFDLNVDIMYRLPGQTIEEVRQDFFDASQLPVTHITAFSLILWPQLVLSKRIEQNKIPPIADFRTYVEMHNAIVDTLNSSGLPQYGCYHFARPSKECLYQIGRWGAPQGEVLGLGTGAFSFFNGYTYCNEHDRVKYIELINAGYRPVQSGKRLSIEEHPSRYMVLGTRLLNIDLDDFYFRYGVEALDYYSEAIDWLTSEGLVQIDGRALKVTRKGSALILDVGRAFYTDNNRGKLQPQYYILDLLSDPSKVLEGAIEFTSLLGN